MTVDKYPVVIIGAGPVGLAAAAHLQLRGQAFVLLEAEDLPAASIRQWRHVRMFSPWKMAIDAAARQLLQVTGWPEPDPAALPTGADLLEQYLEPLAALPQLAEHIRYGTRVEAIGRAGIDLTQTAGRAERPFVIRYSAAGGQRSSLHASAVIDASGTWFQPNPAGADGYPAIGEGACADRIAYGIPEVRGSDRGSYAGKRVLVVGSGHSAINGLLDLVALAQEEEGTQIIWAVRRQNPATLFGGEQADQLPARGLLGTRLRQSIEAQQLQVVTGFALQRIVHQEGQLLVSGTRGGDTLTLPAVDRIIVATGARPDFSFLREVRLNLDSALESAAGLAALIDPNIHSCGTVAPHGEAELRHHERNFYIAGAKSYGRAPTFLLATGYEQVRSIAAWLSGDAEAARAVHLSLPETGACCTDTVLEEQVAASCCGASETQNAGTCC